MRCRNASRRTSTGPTPSARETQHNTWVVSSSSGSSPRVTPTTPARPRCEEGQADRPLDPNVKRVAYNVGATTLMTRSARCARRTAGPAARPATSQCSRCGPTSRATGPRRGHGTQRGVGGDVRCSFSSRALDAAQRGPPCARGAKGGWRGRQRANVDAQPAAAATPHCAAPCLSSLARTC